MAIPWLTFPKIITSGPGDVSGQDWVATEKLHGAQLVVGVDREQSQVGKRKAWLAHDEPFFAWQMLRPLLHRAGRTVHAALGGVGYVWLYGELFGGSYPHPAVPAVHGLVPVQTGIWYAPDLQYALFDIVHALDGQEPAFLGHERVRELAGEAGLLTVPVLGRARLSELDQLPVRFATRVPALLGLPRMESNDAEGYVLKPAGAAPVSSRPAIKKKILEFDEQRFDESAAFDQNTYLSLEELRTIGGRLINPARLASARSKVGTNVALLLEEMVLDALIDLRDMFPRRIEQLAPDEEALLLAHLEQLSRAQLESR